MSSQAPAVSMIAKKKLVPCMHCAYVMSSTHADCPDCGGAVQGLCYSKDCKKDPQVVHKPVMQSKLCEQTTRVLTDR